MYTKTDLQLYMSAISYDINDIEKMLSLEMDDKVKMELINKRNDLVKRYLEYQAYLDNGDYISDEDEEDEEYYESIRTMNKAKYCIDSCCE
jgi:hypothetical protein